MNLRWEVDTQTKNRILCFCGLVAVGAVFPSVGARHVRYRAWVTANMNPVDGTATNLDEAKTAIEQRFTDFTNKAGLR